MNYEIVEKYNSVIITFDKKLIGGPKAETFANDIADKLKEGKKNIIADFTGVTFVNSTGIGIIIRAYTTVKNAGGELKLAGLSEKIIGLLSITKLNSVFEIFGTVEEAIKSFD